MSDSLVIPSALKILQHAVKLLFTNAGMSIPENCSVEDDFTDIISLSDNSEIKALRVLFDRIKLDRGQSENHYWIPREIDNEKPNIPYPQNIQPTSEDIRKYLETSCQEIRTLLERDENWQNESLLALIIEKYGSFIALDDEDVAFVDLIRSTAAVSTALTKNPDAKKLSLIVGDLSGVQKFIYTISSAGALKSLRARSFYLELVTEEIVQQLLEELKLPRTNIIFAGASKLYILATDSDKTKQAVEEIGNKFNQWLKDEFQGKVFLALDSYEFEVAKVSNNEFAEVWSKANKNLDGLRSQKFRQELSDLLTPQPAYEPCKVCHRDDVENLKPLGDDSDVEACGICRRLYRLGGQLRDVKAIVRSQDRTLSSKKYLQFKLSKTEIHYYHLFDDISEAKKKAERGKLFLINNWNINDYVGLDATPLFLGNYSQKSKDDPKAFATAEELAKASQGIERVASLRMDVDNLGKIFATGLGEKQTLPQIAGLSRQMTYFFKVYLNSLAEDRDNNLPQNENYTKIDLPKKGEKRDNLLFIYAGGDDLFISGAWNEVVEFSFDVDQSFRAYTGYNPDITISAGISLAVPKYPLYQAAEDSGDAEEAAKGNGRDSLTLFGETFKWDEWLGNKENIRVSIEQKTQMENLSEKEKEIIDYLKAEDYPDLWGVFSFVKQLEYQKIGTDYTRNFVRNLLNTAQLQEQKLEEIEQKRRDKLYPFEDKDLKYYLHLPQIAYTLARLEKNVKIKDDFRKSLKNPRNAPYYRAIATWIELLNR